MLLNRLRKNNAMAEWYVYALAAMLAFSLANIALKEFVKNDVSRLFDKNRQALTNFALSLVFFLAIAWLVFMDKVNIPAGTLAVIVLVVLLSLGGFVALLFALKSGKVSLVTAILNVSTVLVACIAVAFLGERLTLKETAGIALATAAIFLIAS